MKYVLCDGHPALGGHCPRCNNYIQVLIDVSSLPEYTDVRTVTNIPTKCGYCESKFIAINNGSNDDNNTSKKADEIFEAWRTRFNQSRPKYVAKENTYSCTHCGAERKFGYRYCPQCRLDGAGRPADAGANFYG